MSDEIKHECGIALIRLLKPLEFYSSKYGTSLYGIDKMYLLMEKQHNRGQDGAGIASIKLDIPPGKKYINRLRSNSPSSIKEIFNHIQSRFDEVMKINPDRLKDIQWLKENIEFTGELFLGHLRYGTFGKNKIENCHPLMRENYWMSKNLVIAGNFNLTNVDELFNKLVDIGQHPIDTTDTVTILEKIGHFLDDANEDLFRKFKAEGYSKKEISPLIAEHLDVQNILSNASKYWDGGYVIAGMLGHGDAFVMRDPSGIRPAYYYKDDEVFVAASERSVIQTTFHLDFEKIKEVGPGHAIIIKKNGTFGEYPFQKSRDKASCSFERIYFSRGTDQEIYEERKKLGKLLCAPILKAVEYNIRDTVFSYIPNTALDAFYGLTEALTEFCNTVKKEKILEQKANLTEETLCHIFKLNPRIEKIAVKDAKLRTFITQDNSRDDLVAHVYDVTYGVVRTGLDTVVVLDDSIVRGTTLRQSILRIIDRLCPKKIIVVSSAPQIRYPDCYGIDMAKLSDLIAFRAAIELLKETKQTSIINEVFNKCKSQENLPKEEIVNHVKSIYKPFAPERISEKMAQMLRHKDTKAEVQIIFQTIEDLHDAIPGHVGDWYFTGNYPTPGGNKVVNKSFINYIEGRNERAY